MSKELVKIKGTKNGLVFYFNTKEASFEEVKNKLLEKFTESKGFFADARFMISPENDLSLEETEILTEICAEFGLVKAENIFPEPVNKHPLPTPSDEKTELFSSDGDAVLLTRSLRSGQKVFVIGNAVILGDVNPGAQVAATGSVVVMGTLRGTAHAGSQGERDTFVVAYRMLPTQIRIADKVCRAPENRFSVDYPEEARIIENSIIVRPYQTGKRQAVNA